MSKWISVEDRLPEEGIEVLAHITGIGFGLAVIVSDETDLLGYSVSEFIHEFDYWMPLPEPPEVSDVR